MEATDEEIAPVDWQHGYQRDVLGLQPRPLRGHHWLVLSGVDDLSRHGRSHGVCRTSTAIALRA